MYNITFSPTGGTKKVADFLCDKLGGAQQIDLLKVLNPTAFSAEDVCLFAVPAFAGRVPALAAERIKKLQGNQAKAILLAVYGNREFEDTLLELKDLLTEAGFRITAGVAAVAEHSIVREIAQGRPDAQDYKELAEIAEQIAQKLKSGDDAEPDIPGNHPYRDAGHSLLRTWAADGCINCGVCVEECPAGAISMDAEDLKADDKCFACMRCIAVCPVDARIADPEKVEMIRTKISPACAKRKECKVYL